MMGPKKSIEHKKAQEVSKLSRLRQRTDEAISKSSLGRKMNSSISLSVWNMKIRPAKEAVMEKWLRLPTWGMRETNGMTCLQ